MFIKIMTVAQGWSAHSQQVLKVESEARNAYLEAETKGRYASFDDEAKRQFEPLKVVAINKISDLVAQVQDNPLQSDAANRVLERVKIRFTAQDKTINAAVMVDGKLQSNPILAFEGIDAQNKAINEFTLFEAEERRLLLDRFASVTTGIWRIIYTSLVLVIFSITFKGFAFWWTWRTLKNARAVAKQLRGGQSNGGLKHEEVESLIHLIEQAG